MTIGKTVHPERREHERKEPAFDDTKIVPFKQGRPRPPEDPSNLPPSAA